MLLLYSVPYARMEGMQMPVVAAVLPSLYLTSAQSQHLILSLETSPIRLGLALVAGNALVFSLVVALFALPPRLFGSAKVRAVFLVFLGGALQMGPLISPRMASIERALGISPQLGHPPPYLAAFITIALSLLLLLLAQRAAERFEL